MASEKLGIYSTLSKVGGLSYRGKIMMIAFGGTHVPLLALVIWAVLASGIDRTQVWPLIGVALAATLIGTALTLFCLNRLLRPITLASTALRNYTDRNELPKLPTAFRDEVGVLMSDTHHTLHRLDATRRELSERDATTGLLNQGQFSRILAERMKRSPAEPFAVCAFEITNLDEIVTLFGQSRADQILRALVRRLENSLGHAGLLARVKSNGLACLMNCSSQAIGLKRTEELLTCIAEDSTNDMPFRLNARAGVSFYPTDGQVPEGQLENAMAAVEYANRLRLPMAIYSEKGRRQLLQRYTLEKELRDAIRGNELELYYQPIHDSRKHSTTAAEALIRWNHPRRGLLLPDAFIPLAESTGLIKGIGRWTLERVCKQMNSWSDSSMASIRVAFNLSASQFSDPDLVSTLRTMTERYQVDPNKLEIEITESSAMDDVNRAGTVLGELRRIGVRVAIDDFGTGYSSLSYLRTLPLSKLKIDAEFVQGIDTNLDHQAIARALIALTRDLNLEVLAEGVETVEEVQALQSLGCHLFQGYYFSRPKAVADLALLINHENEAERFPDPA